MSVLKTIFGADTRPLQQGIARAQNAVGKFSGSVKKRLAMAFSTAVIIGFFRNMTNNLDRIGKIAARGFSTDFVQDLGKAADLAGTSMDDATSKITAMWRELNRAGEPSKIVTDNLKALGLTIEQVRGLSPEDAFKAMVEGLKTAEDKSAAFASALTLLRDRGGELMPLLRELATNGFPSFEKASSASVKSAEIFNDNLTRIGHQLMTFFAPALQVVAVAMEWLKMSFNGFFENLGTDISTAGLQWKALSALIKAAMTFDFTEAKKQLREIGEIASNSMKLKAEMKLEREGDFKKMMDRIFEESAAIAAPAPLLDDEGAPKAGKPARVRASVEASSLQRIGGGGISAMAMQRNEALSVAQDQLSVLQDIRNELSNIDSMEMR
jgi:hypothetical protein